MASGIIEVVIGAVVGKLGELAVEEVRNQASILINFRKDFQWLQSNLTKARAYLQYADGLYMKDMLVKKWLADVRDIAFDAQDIVEEFAVHRGSFTFRCKVGKKIRELRDGMESIMKDAAELKLVKQICSESHPDTFDGREKWKRAGLVERDARPVAIDAKVEEILHLLENDALQIIAVVGMGGIGKTFLLQNVYNHPKVRQRFQKTIWLSISQIYSVIKLQYDIDSHLKLGIKEDKVSEQRAAELIHERLKDESCLIVLDDVWRVEGVNNLIQRLGIPGGTTNLCKIVVTTRSMEVCNIIGASQIYHMKLLSDQDSWNLFCLHAFPDEHQNRPSEEIDKIAHQVERECCRLPLAVKTVAASMASQKLLSNWELKFRQLKEVRDPDDPIIPILGLSYNALPGVLKHCFLYFSFFQEDEEIDAEYLIYLWMGEGFIPKGKEQWRIGWSYLKQLNNLCLVEVEEDEDLKSTCKIHDLLLDLAISISKENACAFTLEEASAVGCRRILLANKGLGDASIRELKCPKSLRTLSLSENNDISELPRKLLRDVRALRVLDLSWTHISHFPRYIRNFKLLRVLNLSGIEFGKVPNCVRNLKSLCFLGARFCPMPEWIGDLKCLQHLHVHRVDYSRKICMGISKLVSLRTLRSGDCSSLALKDVAKLIHLQELEINTSRMEERGNVEEGVLAVAELVNMRRLTINCRQINYPHFPEKMKAMKDLDYLHLAVFTVQRSICEHGNLRVLALTYCDLTQWSALETMPNLIKLKLIGCKCKTILGNFPQLLSLRIYESPELEKLPELRQGAMPRVEVFDVWGCGLREIPEGFEELRSLKLLHLRENRFECEQRERLVKGGEYWNKIKANNPHVTIRI